MILFNQHLQHFVNVDKLRVGGHETEYCLYTLHHILENKFQTFDEDYPDVLNSIADIDFKKLNAARPNQNNHDIIVDVIYQILDTLSTKHPEWLNKCKEIDSKVSKANPWFVDYAENHHDGRTESFNKFRAKCNVSAAAQRISNQWGRQ